MFDLTFRPVKDRIFDPICKYIPSNVTPLHITVLAFLFGILACISAGSQHRLLSLVFWILNRVLDCLDGALARHLQQESDLGGFLDLLGDFIVYSGIPISCAIALDQTLGESLHSEGSRMRLWLATSLLEATFHINNFILFFVAAIVEKSKIRANQVNSGKRQRRQFGTDEVKELTSVAMRPALVEGLESGIIFTAMLALPSRTEEIAWLMGGLVSIGIVQRMVWVIRALKRTSNKPKT